MRRARGAFRRMTPISTWQDRRLPVEFARFRTVALVAVKYKIQHIVDSAVSRLRERYPTSLKKWDDANDREPIIMVTEDHIAAAGVARACDALDILPVVLYQCCAAGSSAVLKGVSCGDEVVRLSQHDTNRCLKAFPSLYADNTRLFDHAMELCLGAAFYVLQKFQSVCCSAASDYVPVLQGRAVSRDDLSGGHCEQA